MQFSTFLKQLRNNAGYTQQNVADMLGINRSTYAYYECGKTEPAIRHLLKLASLYKLHMEDLVSCRYCPTNLVLCADESAMTSDIADLQKFRTLSAKEQQLILLYRSVDDPDAILQHIRNYNENNA